MMAGMLRWNLVIIAAIAAGVTWWMAGQWSAPALALCFVVVFLAPSVLMLVNTLVAAHIAGSPVPREMRMRALAALGYAFREWYCYVMLFLVVQPFERLWLSEDRLKRLAEDDLPLLLVHGYGCNRATWIRLRPRLEALGYCVSTVNLEPPLGPIAAYADVLHRRIEEVCAATGASRLIVIGHSMGGLATRAYCEIYGEARLAALITLGTPHHGSWLAKMGLGANARDMEPGSAFLTHLAKVPCAPAFGVTALYSVHDNYVMPQAQQAFDGADNIVLSGIGHLGLVFSADITRRIQQRLAEINAMARRAARAQRAAPGRAI